MRMLILLPLLLASCGTPAYAGIFPNTYDDSCHMISQKYQHQNPGANPYDTGKTDVEKQQGYIPPEFQGDDSDILPCIPLTVMGPK